MGDSTLVGRGESRERGAAYNQENSEKEQPPASKQQGPRIPNICVSGGQLNISNWTSSENSIAVLCVCQYSALPDGTSMPAHDSQ